MDLLQHMFFNESLVIFKKEDNVYGRFLTSKITNRSDAIFSELYKMDKLHFQFYILFITDAIVVSFGI